MTDTISPQNAALLDLPPVMATFLKANSADAYAEADRHPIAIVKNGRRTHVLMSAEAYSALARTEPPNPAPSAEGVEAVARIIEDMVSGPILRDPLLREAHRQDVLKAAAAILALPAQSVSQTDTLAERVAVPAGWRLVPEEISDGDSVGEIFAILEDFGCEDLSVAEAYAKIVETMARPTPPPSPGPETGALKPMSAAKKDRSEIIGFLRDDIYPVLRPGRDDLEAWNGRTIIMRHNGLASDGFDVGWSVAAPVGNGGLPDDWFKGWLPVPAALHPQTSSKGEV